MQDFSVTLTDGVTISSKLVEADVSLIYTENKRDMGNGYVWYYTPVTELHGKKIGFSLCFFHGIIYMINFSISDPDLYGYGWNELSEKKEKARAKDTEKWLNSIGYKTGKYPWGEIWVGFDSKGFSGHATVRYAI